jgi:hypothetical protein
MAVRFAPVSKLTTVTAARGKAAPLGSTTVPTMALVVSPWARRPLGQSAKDASHAITKPKRMKLGYPNIYR